MIRLVGEVALVLLLLFFFSSGVAHLVENWSRLDKMEYGILNAKEWLCCVVAGLIMIWMLWVSTRKTT